LNILCAIIKCFLQRVRIARNADCCTKCMDHFCLSARPSLIPSRSGIVSRRMKTRSYGSLRMVGQSVLLVSEEIKFISMRGR